MSSPFESLNALLAHVAAYDEAETHYRYVFQVMDAPLDEVEAWVTENVRGPYSGEDRVYAFEDQIDATAFKLRWG